MLLKAWRVLDQMSVQDMVAWTVLIHGFIEHGHGYRALSLFEQMHQQGLLPDIFTISCILKACGAIGCIQKGKRIHAKIVKGGSLMKDQLFDTALIDMYAKCGELIEAKKIFCTLQSRSVVSWTTLISGYIQHGHYEDALNSCELMQQEGFSPNSVTFLCILKACACIGAINKGKQIHKEIVRQGLLGKDAFLGNTLVDMYAKCGAFAKAVEVFTKLPIRNVVSWNAIIAGYVQYGYGEEALDHFEQMQHERISPNAITMVCILKACGIVGAIDKGRLIHLNVTREQSLEKDVLVGNALLDMYVKCGLFTTAQKVFDKLPLRNVATWTSLITGYAHLEREGVVVDLFRKMREEGIGPNVVTFTAILNACSHAGLLDKGQMWFVSMNEQYGIVPTLEHHMCMVDLFSRAGHFDRAVSVIHKMPNSNHAAAWTTLLGACCKSGNLALGKLAFEQAVELDSKDAASYIAMSNMYVAAAMLEDAQRIEAMRVHNEALV
jgi:pentatricopeptide repeat protein